MDQKTPIVELRLGQTVLVNGHEYILVYFTEGADLQGRTFRAEGMDSTRAMEHMEQQRQRRMSLQSQEKLAQMMPKMEQALDEQCS